MNKSVDEEEDLEVDPGAFKSIFHFPSWCDLAGRVSMGLDINLLSANLSSF